MKNTVLWALVGLNVLLLASFLGQFVHGNVANAQAARRPVWQVIN